MDKFITPEMARNNLELKDLEWVLGQIEIFSKSRKDALFYEWELYAKVPQALIDRGYKVESTGQEKMIRVSW